PPSRSPFSTLFRSLEVYSSNLLQMPAVSGNHSLSAIAPKPVVQHYPSTTLAATNAKFTLLNCFNYCAWLHFGVSEPCLDWSLEVHDSARGVNHTQNLRTCDNLISTQQETVEWLASDCARVRANRAPYRSGAKCCIRK